MKTAQKTKPSELSQTLGGFMSLHEAVEAGRITEDEAALLRIFARSISEKQCIHHKPGLPPRVSE